MGKIIAITQARSGSTRLPKKILKKVKGLTLLEIHLKRLQKSNNIDDLIVATTTSNEDDEVKKIAELSGVDFYRGSENDVLDRFYQAVRDKNAEYVVRLTSDCPLIDSSLVDKIVEHTIQNNLDYCSNTLKPTFPDGQDVEVFKYSALGRAWKEASLKSDREHVTPFIWKNSTFNDGNKFMSENFSNSSDYSQLRMTVDEFEDLKVVESLIENLGVEKSWIEYADFLLANKNIRLKNSRFQRNEGFLKSLKDDNE